MPLKQKIKFKFMKRWYTPLWLVTVLTILLAGCSKKNEVELEQTFVLKYKHTATIGSDLEIKFYELSDSRCPTDVECIVPGDLEIGLKVNNEKHELLLGSANHSKVVKDGFEVELKDASPLSFASNDRPRKKDYSVYLIVRKVQ